VQAQEFLGRHMTAVDRFYILDHHHLARALDEEGVKEVLVNVVSDLSSLSRQSFWTVCEHRAWTHPYGTEGLRRSVDDIPKRVGDLKDDPYRSLAGELRRAGGFAKDVTPFSEFLWADFLRRRITRKRVVSAFEAAVVKALDLAKSPEASYLPGWRGPIED
jgi:hypothetical protein